MILLATMDPDANVDVTPMPGKVQSPHIYRPGRGVLWSRRVLFPASTRGLFMP